MIQLNLLLKLMLILLSILSLQSLEVELFINYKLDVSQYNITSTNYEIPFVYPSFKQCDNQWGNDLMVTKVLLLFIILQYYH